MERLRPSLDFLAALPNSEVQTFGTAWSMCQQSVTPDLDRKGGSGYGGSKLPYKKLDNALVLAIASLYGTVAQPYAEGLAEAIMDERTGLRGLLHAVAAAAERDMASASGVRRRGESSTGVTAPR